MKLNQIVGMGPLLRETKEAGSPPVRDDNRPHPVALPDVLEADDYQVVFVPRSEWECIQGSQAEPAFPAAAVLVPFSWKEIVARIYEFVRDSNPWSECRGTRFEDFCIDFTKMEVSRSSGEPITMTVQEFKTLKCFLLNPGRVLSRRELLSEAWGYENYPSTRTVDTHVLRLRRKLERDPAKPVHFRTVHRVGYKFVP